MIIISALVSHLPVKEKSVMKEMSVPFRLLVLYSWVSLWWQPGKFGGWLWLCIHIRMCWHWSAVALPIARWKWWKPTTTFPEKSFFQMRPISGLMASSTNIVASRVGQILVCFWKGNCVPENWPFVANCGMADKVWHRVNFEKWPSRFIDLTHYEKRLALNKILKLYWIFSVV